MTQGEPLESAARRRLRSLRQARGWSLEELGRRTGIGPSTLSRLETGRRRLALDHLVSLARVLDVTVDDLLVEDGDEDVVIHPRRDSVGGATFWLLSPPDDTSGRVVVKMRVPEAESLPETRVHPGRDWFYVLEGTVRVHLASREILVPTGRAATFNTMIPHSVGGHEGPAEILSILDHHGERAHLHA